MKAGVLGGVVAIMLAASPHTALARDHNNKARDTAIGVGLGLLGGAILSDGDPWATLAGGAAGGVVGNVSAGGHHDGWGRGPGQGRGDAYQPRGWGGDPRRNEAWGDVRRQYFNHGGVGTQYDPGRDGQGPSRRFHF